MRGARAAGTVVTAAAVAALVRLAIWQWERGSSRGSLMNYTYAAEWLLLALALLVAVVLRRRRGAPLSDESASRDVAGRLLGPPLRPGEQLGPATHVQVRRWFTRRR